MSADEYLKKLKAEQKKLLREAKREEEDDWEVDCDDSKQL